MRPINTDNPRELERFADIVERTVVSLKENKKFADMEGDTLYAIVLEKLPQALLSHYYRWIKEKGSMESLEDQSCITGLLIKLSTRYKHQKLSMVCPVLEIHNERAKPSLISGSQKRNVIVPVKCASKNPQFGNWNFKGMEHRKKWEMAKKLGLCYHCLRKGHLSDSCT